MHRGQRQHYPWKPARHQRLRPVRGPRESLPRARAEALQRGTLRYFYQQPGADTVACELRQHLLVTTHLLATGQVVHGPANAQLLALLKETRHHATLANPLTVGQATLRKYDIVTLLENAADTLATNEVSRCYLLVQAIAQLVKFVFATQPRPLPGLKSG